MSVRAVQVSLDEELLARLDEDPEVRSEGRSAFVRRAIRHYLKARERESIDRAIVRAYEGLAGEDLAEAEDLIDGQAWPGE